MLFLLLKSIAFGFSGVIGATSLPPIIIRNLTTTKYSKAWDLSTCVLPNNGFVGVWRVGLVASSWIINCTTREDTIPWIRLKSYRSGGLEGLHWKFLRDDMDVRECLKNWRYYAKDGSTLIAQIHDYSTTLGDPKNRSWCPINLYQGRGKRGYLWDYCVNCTMVITHPGPGSTTQTTTPEPKTKIKQE